ncbi:MAG TPA: hypothetical protein DCW29_15490 [Janthinobacterium sp.]|nr:hypothetical protein [Janthinobacterium sp.]
MSAREGTRPAAGMNVRLADLSGAFRKTLMTTVGITVISFISSVITARILGPEGRGLLSAALMIGSLAAGVSQLGLANSFVYHFGAARAFPYLRLLFASLVAVGLVAAALAWGGVHLSDKPQLGLVLPGILALALCMATQTYFFSLAQLHADLHFFNQLRFSLVLFNLVLLLPVVWIFDTVTFQQLLYAQLLVAAGLTLAGLYWARKHRVWRLNEAGEASEAGAPAAPVEIVRYGLHQHGTVLLGLLLLNYDKLVLLNRGSLVEYGYYALAFGTSRLIGAVQDAVAVALYARFAGKDIEQLGEKVRTAFRLTFLPMLLLAAIGAALSPWLIVGVYGHKYAAMALPFAILLFECVIGGASWTLAQRFNAGGRPGLVLVRQFISVVPVFAAMPFLPEKNVYVYLALLMLAGASLRLAVTMIMYPGSLKEPVPSVIPTRQDLRMVRALLTRSGKK